jgi:DNA-binding response OmpR family regulator
VAPAPEQSPPALPVLDADDVLRGADDRWVALSQIEGRLLHLLLERPRQVVRREELEAAAWPRTTPGARALDVAIVRLRRRIEPFALSIHTVRGTGYLLEADRG